MGGKDEEKKVDVAQQASNNFTVVRRDIVYLRVSICCYDIDGGVE